jgi:uncharacterized protein (TIGR00645 family)
MNAESIIERLLFASRWLMAPIYLGLAASLALLVYIFVVEFVEMFAGIAHFKADEIILGVLGLIDLSLSGNLILIVIFSGYENFVSKLDIDDHKDRPDWHGSVDFTNLKLKLIGSMVAISGIHLLRVFMDIGKYSLEEVKWMIILHVVFVGSGVILAAMDWISSRAKPH